VTPTYHAGIYVAVCPFMEREIPKSAGLRWNPGDKRWETADWRIAARLESYCDAGARAAIERDRGGTQAAVDASRAQDAEIEIPVPEGLSYLPFQRAGIAYALRIFGDLN